MDYYYLDCDNRPQGPFDLLGLQHLIEKGVIDTDCLVAKAGSSQWLACGQLLRQHDQANAAQSRYYRLSTTSNLTIKRIPVVKKNDKIVMLQEYATVADGSKKKLLLQGENNPTTPAKAVEAFIAGQKQVVELAKAKYEHELALLEEAQKMLQRPLPD